MQVWQECKRCMIQINIHMYFRIVTQLVPNWSHLCAKSAHSIASVIRLNIGYYKIWVNFFNYQLSIITFFIEVK